MLTMWISQNSPERRLRLPKGSRSLAPQRHRFRPKLEGLEGRTVLSTLTVLNTLDKGAGSLRDTITGAKSGDTIDFASSLNGQTIILTSGELAISQSLDIEGPGASLLAISGNNANRVFDISQNQKAVAVTIAGLTIQNGLSSGSSYLGEGGGILNVSSTLTLNNDVLSNNEALANSPNTASKGGAIANRNGGTLTITACTFTGNEALGQAGGGRGFGGAIYNVATATVIGSTFTGNLAQGGDGGLVTSGIHFVGVAAGGAIDNDNLGTLTVAGSTFTGNLAIAGNGGNGGSGASAYAVDLGCAGGIVNSGTLDLSGSTFTSNQAIG